MRRLLVFLSILLVASCASQPQSGRFSLAEQQETPPVWPAYPNVPRYHYLGQLVGEENVLHEEREAGRGKRFLAWLVGLQEEAPDVLRLLRPQSGMVDTETRRVLVTDVGLNAVVVFDEANATVDLWYQADRQEMFAAPIAIVKTGPDEFLVSDAELGRLVRLSGSGEPLGSISDERMLRPSGMVFDAVDDLIYVADTEADDVKVFTPGGVLAGVIGLPGEEPGQFNAPTHVALDDNRLIVSDTLNARLQVLTVEGSALDTVGQRGLFVGNFVRPKGVAADSDGNIYAVESYFDHLLVYDREGRLLLSIGGTGAGVGQFYLPAGVWVDDRDRIFIADMHNGRVVVLQYLGST
jgi:DNA-binding beta-propeller fold protein YncE